MKRQSEATKTRKQEHAEARKQVMQQTAVPAQSAGSKRPSKARKAWEDKLNADRAGAAPDAGEFTKQFMTQMYSGSTSSSHMEQGRFLCFRSKVAVVEYMRAMGGYSDEEMFRVLPVHVKIRVGPSGKI